jgi:hypothetical protein
MVVEKAVKYSEREGKGKVSYESLKKVLGEMKINIQITEEDVERIQRPETMLTQLQSIGVPSEKRVRENISSLRERMKVHQDWLARKRRKIEKAKELVSEMERKLRS